MCVWVLYVSVYGLMCVCVCVNPGQLKDIHRENPLPRLSRLSVSVYVSVCKYVYVCVCACVCVMVNLLEAIYSA